MPAADSGAVEGMLMTTRTLARVVLRLLGLLLVILAAGRGLDVAARYVAQAPAAGAAGCSGIASGLGLMAWTLLAGGVLLAFDRSIARRLFPADDVLAFSLDAAACERLLLALLGVAFIVSGLDGALELVAEATETLRRPDLLWKAPFSWAWRLGLPSCIVSLGVGLVLLFGWSGLRGIVNRVRPLGAADDARSAGDPR